MKKLLITILSVLILLSGCVAVTPQSGETVSPSPAVSESAGPAETDAPSPDVSGQPGESPDVPAVTPGVSADTGTPPAKPAVSDKVLSYTNEYINVNAICPEVSGLLDPVLQQDVNSSAYEETEKLADEIKQEAADDTASDSSYYLRSIYVVRRNDGVILSISRSTEYFNGGATESSKMSFINVRNTAQGQRLTLGDLFTPGADYESVINSSINDEIAANPDMSDFTFSGISSDQGFYLTDSELVIVFDRYKIAPGVVGEPEFNIPLSELGDILIPEVG